MKFLILLTALITAIQAQTCAKVADAMPQCGKTCIETAAAGPTVNCAFQDFACYCAKQTIYENTAILCVAKNCKPEEITKVQDGAKAVCACLGKAA